MKTSSLPHSTRKHSDFSASGAERWTHCPGSVSLSRGMPDKDSVWSVEGTRAHEVLEKILMGYKNTGALDCVASPGTPMHMRTFAKNAARFIVDTRIKHPGADVLVETRISLPFIHHDMFGTFDAAVVDHFGVLNVFDFKYGKSPVSPTGNLQMIFYGLGLAANYFWNFSKVRLWIIQPRVYGYDGPTFWDISIDDLKKFVEIFRSAVKRVYDEPETFVEGSWCHWCKAKTKCPVKQKGKLEKAMVAFKDAPILEDDDE